MTSFATQRDTVEALFNDNWSETPILYEFTDMKPDSSEFIHLQIAPVLSQDTTLKQEAMRTESLVRVTCYASNIYRSAELMDMVDTLMVGSDIHLMTTTVGNSGSMKADLFFYSIGYNIFNY